MSHPVHLFLATKNPKDMISGFVYVSRAYGRLAGFIRPLLLVFFVAKPVLVDRFRGSVFIRVYP
jgi:hypothetical protein